MCIGYEVKVLLSRLHGNGFRMFIDFFSLCVILSFESFVSELRFPKSKKFIIIFDMVFRF